MIEHRLHDRSGQAAVIAAMAAWDAGGRPVPGLHRGDLGWAWRDPEEAYAVHGWWDGATLAAVALVEGPVARPRVAPDRLHDEALAATVTGVLGAAPGADLWADAEPGGALRAALAAAGWSSNDDDPWVCLHLDLTAWPGPAAPPGAEPARDHPEERVAVQRAGFAGSSFTLEKWRRMAAGPAYRPDLDLLVRAPDGSPAAAGTAWLSAPGGTAVLEPVATHPDHRRAGHARRLVHALADGCRAAGARGLTVWTPQRNEAAVTAYTRSGFEVADVVCTLHLGR